MPLRHRDTVVGSVTLRAATPFGASDVALLHELAARAAVAIENAQLYAREHRVAMTLQRAMLPAVLPDVAGLAFDAVYFPGATEAEIGGDWYDAIALPDGRVVVSIGDVTGRGLTAAVIMGRMRQAIETLATYESDPVRLLDAADSVLRRAHPDAIVTALVGVVDPAARTLAYATAGHPTPIVRASGGMLRQLPGRGLPLGLREGREAPATTVVLPPSSLVVFFTDGLVESTRDIDEGERRVFAALADPAVADGRAPAAALVARVLDDGIRDDVAVLTLRLSGGPSGAHDWTMRWRFDPHDWRRAYDVRETLAEALRAYGTGVDLPAAELVFGELVGNAVRHAPGFVEVELTWDDATTPVLHVIDDGPGYAPRTGLPSPDAESGRGSLHRRAAHARVHRHAAAAPRRARARGAADARLAGPAGAGSGLRDDRADDLAETDARVAAHRAPADDHRVAVGEKAARLAVRQRERLRAAARQLDERALRALLRAGDRAGAEEIARAGCASRWTSCARAAARPSSTCRENSCARS